MTCLPIDPICNIGDFIGGVAGDVADSIFTDVANAFARAAARVTEWMWTVIAQTTTVDLSGDWFDSMFGVTLTLAGVVVVAIFTLELIKGVLRREPGVLGRALTGVGGGVLGAFASIGVVQALLVMTDALSDGVVTTVGLPSIGDLGRTIAPAGTIAGIAEPALVLILALGYLLASFFVWAMFIVRKAMIIVAAVFAPVAFSGAAARATTGWARRWIEFTLAMVFSKLVVVIIFTLALSIVGSPGKGLAAVGNLFSGLTMLVLACFAPWALLKLVHFLGGDVIAAHHQGVSEAVMKAGSTPVAMARMGATRSAGVVAGGAGQSAASTQPNSTAGASIAPKVLMNNPVIKSAPGSGPATAAGSAGGPKSPPSGPRGGGPLPRPQPASAPTAI